MEFVIICTLKIKSCWLEVINYSTKQKDDLLCCLILAYRDVNSYFCFDAFWWKFVDLRWKCIYDRWKKNTTINFIDELPL